ncbi:pyruvate kinase [Candidatus Woesebacteria bacterium]|nr:MAG: pyruvate kinase [Candidatus Woesebacteria bacterium]
MLYKKTKIIATLGPSSQDREIIRDLIVNGVDIFRFNMKHADIKWHEDAIGIVQEVADDLKTLVGIMIDLQGPELRIKVINDIEANIGDEIEFVLDPGSTCDVIGVKNKAFFDGMIEGDEFSIDDGSVGFIVTKTSSNSFFAKAKDWGVIKNNKGLNLVGKNLDVPSLVDDDIAKLHLVTKKKVDFVALSFVRSKKDITHLRKVMGKMQIDAGIVSKVESKMGLDNIDEIIEESDAVMVARGDLGIEVPFEQLAYYQKDIIKRCRIAKTPVIVATQMLETMMTKPVPSRAEATDVANAIFDGTDAIMLSGESAMGKFPVRAVKAMANIAKFNEQVAKISDVEMDMSNDAQLIINAAGSLANVSTSLKNNQFKIDYIVAVTESGSTARSIASYRPYAPIIALTPHEKTAEKLKMSYGVIPVVIDFPLKGELIHPYEILSQLKDNQFVKKDQLILVIYGQQKDVPGKTNSIVLLRVV